VTESTSPGGTDIADASHDADPGLDPAVELDADLDADDLEADPFFDPDDDTPLLPRRRHHVTTVVVAHDGAVWLPAVLTTLAQQTRQTNAVVGVDNASDDASAAVLTESLGEQRVVLRDANDGFGAAVNAGLAAVPAVEPPLPSDVVSWVWLLHDDSAADPTCLERLLDSAETTHRPWSSARRCSAGTTVDCCSKWASASTPMGVG